MTYVTAAAGDS